MSFEGWRAAQKAGQGEIRQPRSAPRPSLMGLLERLVVALERLAARDGGFRGGIAASRDASEDVDYVSDEQEAVRELKRALYERHAGRTLPDDEDPPELPKEEELRDLFVAPGAR